VDEIRGLLDNIIRIFAKFCTNRAFAPVNDCQVLAIRARHQ
jgi:hypothetical protein